MNKPLPKIALEVQRFNGTLLQVIPTETLWTVLYKGRPMKLKYVGSINSQVYYVPRYPRVTFPKPGNALHLADELNSQFGCNDFTVVEIYV